MKILNRLYEWYGKRVVLTVLGVIAALVVAGIIAGLVFNRADTATLPETNVSKVQVARVDQLANASGFSVVGTVEAVSEANLQTEASGRVTSVLVHIGDQVSAGAVLATLENSRERAALLQAEGAYEATVAQSAQSDVGLAEAEVAVQNTYRDAFTASESAVRNLADELFSNPQAQIPGFKLDAQGRAVELNTARTAIESILTKWQAGVLGNFTSRSPEALSAEAEENTTTINNFITKIAQLVAEEEPNSEFTQAILASYKTRFEGARASLNGTLAAISASRRGYENAELSASGDTASLSDAQQKSALGVLRAAQANYEKTLVRTPISGSVNALYLKTGDYASIGTAAAVVANNGSLEINTAIGEEDRALLAVGGAVTIDGNASGTITRIAPGIDPSTGKIAVTIAVQNGSKLLNGTTVSIDFEGMNTKTSNELVVPIVALKMLPSSPVAFTIVDGLLVAHAVVLGEVRGSGVVVLEGLTGNMEIVTDARGLSEGEEVTIRTN